MSMPTAKEKATPIAKEADVDTELSEAYDEIEMRKLLYPEGYEGFSTFSISTNKDGTKFTHFSFIHSLLTL
jgi:hypothetical protein